MSEEGSSNHWQKKIEGIVAKRLPSLEIDYTFPWEDVSSALSQALGIAKITLSPRTLQKKSHEEILAGMGNDPLFVAIEIAPLSQPLFWAMSREDVAAFTAHLLSGQEGDGFSDFRLQEGYYQFLLLEALQAIQNLVAFRDLSLHLLPTASPPLEGGFCLDVALVLAERTLYGRVVFSQTFLEAFGKEASVQKPSLLENPAAREVEVVLQLEVGHVTLSKTKWSGVMPGDCIVLDHCSFDPNTEKGSLSLVLDKEPILRARVKPEGIKITEYGFYHEPEAELEETIEGLTLFTVEAGRLQMTVAKLLELTPGATLECSVRPQQSADLCIDGRVVAKGELIKLGELLGVRIVDKHG